MPSLGRVLLAQDGLKALPWGLWEPQGGVATEGGKGAVPVPINHAAGPTGYHWAGVSPVVMEVPVSGHGTAGSQAALMQAPPSRARGGSLHYSPCGRPGRHLGVSKDTQTLRQRVSWASGE